MREKEKFGKKPVRRSKSEEKEKARAYKPRTAKKFNVEKKPKEDSEEQYAERKTSRENREYERKSSRTREKSQTDRQKRTYSNKSDTSSYKPRTLRSKSYDSKPEQKGKSRYEESDFEPKDNRKKSYYEEKFGKPKYSKPERFEDKRTRKFEEPKLVKKSKTYQTAPEIESELKTDKEGLIRLNKYIANSGLCSRREADEYIENGRITVNGVVVKELGTKVKLTDEVRFKDKTLDPEKKVYILLNKPKDYITTVEDPNAPRTVMDLIKGACEQRVYPVGRLDRNSTGLLLLTNDGELTKRLTHPSFMKKKIYEVGLDNSVRPEDLEAIRSGIELEGEMIKADAIEYIDDRDKSTIGIEIHTGQNRIVRRIFEHLGYRVQKLDRVYFAGLTKKNLPRGKWRFLSQKEVSMLKMNRF